MSDENVIIDLRSIDKEITHIDNVLTALRRAGVKQNIRNCIFSESNQSDICGISSTCDPTRNSQIEASQYLEFYQCSITNLQNEDPKILQPVHQIPQIYHDISVNRAIIQPRSDEEHTGFLRVGRRVALGVPKANWCYLCTTCTKLTLYTLTSNILLIKTTVIKKQT